ALDERLLFVDHRAQERQRLRRRGKLQRDQGACAPPAAGFGVGGGSDEESVAMLAERLHLDRRDHVLTCPQNPVERRRQRRHAQEKKNQRPHCCTLGSLRMTWPCCAVRCSPESSSQYIRLFMPSDRVSVSGSCLPSISVLWKRPSVCAVSWAMVEAK